MFFSHLFSLNFTVLWVDVPVFLVQFFYVWPSLSYCLWCLHEKLFLGSPFRLFHPSLSMLCPINISFFSWNDLTFRTVYLANLVSFADFFYEEEGKSFGGSKISFWATWRSEICEVTGNSLLIGFLVSDAICSFLVTSSGAPKSFCSPTLSVTLHGRTFSLAKRLR